MSDKLTTAVAYAQDLFKEIWHRFDTASINDRDMLVSTIRTAFKSGVKEGRRRQQEHLVYLIKRDRWDETDLPVPEGHDDRLPGYHALLNHLCDQLHVAGAVTFYQAVENVKKRLEEVGSKCRFHGPAGECGACQ